MPPSLGRRRDFRAVFDQLEDVALWTATEPGRFDYISDGFEGIWGIPPEDVEDDIEGLLDTIHPDDRDRVRENMDPDGSCQGPYEGRVVRPDGSVRWVLTRQAFVGEGRDAEAVGLTTDITDQKRREQELEMLNRVVRHDIRNDIAVVLGWAELLEEHVDDEGKEHLQRILDSGEHIVELTETAREFVETVTESGDPAVEPTPLSSVLETELSLREESFPEAEFVLEDPIPDVEVAVNGMASSVFRNLLNNAVQHNDRETPVVKISCEVGEEAVAVRIADDGPGIPDEQKEVVFGKGEKSLGSPGSGIGLHLVRTLVDQYGGDVRVEDNEPTGAVFVVSLPRAD